MSKSGPSKENILAAKEETRKAVINALLENKPNDVEGIQFIEATIDAIKRLNLTNSEQWGTLDLFADKVVKFRKSKNLKDLQ